MHISKCVSLVGKKKMEVTGFFQPLKHYKLGKSSGKAQEGEVHL
jgi:hypothetical protein